jgi:hypothetical protein
MSRLSFLRHYSQLRYEIPPSLRERGSKTRVLMRLRKSILKESFSKDFPIRFAEIVNARCFSKKNLSKNGFCRKEKEF